MSMRTLSAIREAEERSISIVEEAKQEAGRQVELKRKEEENRQQEIMKEAQLQKQQIMSKAREKAETQCLSLEAENQLVLQKYENPPESKVEEAIKLVVERVLMYGC